MQGGLLTVLPQKMTNQLFDAWPFLGQAHSNSTLTLASCLKIKASRICFGLKVVFGARWWCC